MSDSSDVFSADMRGVLHRLCHASESVVMAESSAVFRRCLDDAYEIGIPRPDEDNCPCEACAVMRVTRDELLDEAPSLKERG